MSLPTDLIGIWSTTVPGAVLSGLAVPGASDGDLYIYADGTYIWYTSYGINGIKQGTWSPSGDPAYPLILQDTVENYNWYVGFQKDASSIYLVPRRPDGQLPSFWYYGALSQALPGKTTPSNGNPMLATPEASINVFPGLKLIQNLNEPAPDQTTYTINNTWLDDFSPLFSLGFGQSAGLLINGSFANNQDTDTYVLNLINSLTQPQAIALSQDFRLVVAITAGAQFSASKTGNGPAGFLTSASLNPSNPYKNTAAKAYFLPTLDIVGGNPTFEITQTNPAVTTYNLFIGFVRESGVADLQAAQGNWLATGFNTEAYAILRTVGNVSLARNSLGYGLVIAGVFQQIQYFGLNVNGPAGWQIMAAISSGSGYMLYWKNLITGQYISWDLNSQGVYISHQSLSLASIIASEVNLGIDLSGDSQTGINFSGISTIGGLELGSTSFGYWLRTTTSYLEIRYQGVAASAGYPGLGWVAVAAIQSGSNYLLYWRNNISGQIAVWGLNGQGNVIGSAVLSLAEALALEAVLGVDFDGDGSTSGVVYNPIQAVGAVQLVSSQLGYSLQIGSSIISISYLGITASAGYPGLGWVAVGAIPSGSNYLLYWRNNISGQIAVWGLNGQGNVIGSAFLSLAEALALEAVLGVDFDGDGSTSGVVDSLIKTLGGLQLVSSQLGYSLLVGTSRINISFLGIAASVGFPGQGWQAVAAIQSGSNYLLYWLNSISSQIAVWGLNGQGNVIGSAVLSLAEALALEGVLGVDFDGDGSTSGVIYNPIQAVGAVQLVSSQLGYSLQIGSTFISISYLGIAISAGYPGQGWKALAAATTSNGYLLYWQNTVTGQYAQWGLDAQGRYLGSILLTTQQFLSIETSLNADLNKNGTVGLSFNPISNIGGLSFGNTELGYAIQINSNTLSIRLSGSVLTDFNLPSGWFPIAASTGNGNPTPYALYWYNNSLNIYGRWDLNANGDAVGFSTFVGGEIDFEEIKIDADLTNDGLIGPLAINAGTPAADQLFGATKTATLGLANDDTLTATSQLGYDWLIGGTGNDTYIAGNGVQCLIMDHGSSPFDQIIATGINLADSYYATMEGGRHLVIGDNITGTTIYLLDWQQNANQIESLVLADNTTYTYSEMVTLFGTVDPSFDYTWQEWDSLVLNGQGASLLDLPTLTTARIDALSNHFAALDSSLTV